MVVDRAHGAGPERNSSARRREEVVDAEKTVVGNVLDLVAYENAHGAEDHYPNRYSHTQEEDAHYHLEGNNAEGAPY